MAVSVYMVVLGIQSILGNQIMYIKRKEHILVRALLVFGVINTILKPLLEVRSIHTNVSNCDNDTFNTIACVAYVSLYQEILKDKLSSVYDGQLKIFTIFCYIHTNFLCSSAIRVRNSPFISNISYRNGLAYILLLFLTKDEILFMVISRLSTKFKKS